MMAHLRSNSLSTRKKIVQQIKAEIHNLLGDKDHDLQAYEENFENEFRGPAQTINKAKFLKQISKANIILGADFHAFSQAQRTHLRILRELIQGQRLILYLECFETKHQKDLDSYLQNRITEVEFLDRIRFHERWKFPWSHYKPLVDFAKKNHVPVFAINSIDDGGNPLSLLQRDKNAARVIAHRYVQNEFATHYVVFGELHLAKPHLPFLLKQALPETENPKVVRVFQNVDRLYFRSRTNRSSKVGNILQLASDKFCVMNFPPWMKWQSYLLALENQIELGYEEDGSEGLDFTGAMHRLLHIISADLQLSLSADSVRILHGDSDPLEDVLSGKLNVKEQKIVQELIRLNQSFVVPENELIVLSNTRLNQAAEMWGHLIQARLSQRVDPLFEMPDNFLQLVWVNALGFFVSKVVNPDRKPDQGKAFERLRDISQVLVEDALAISLEFYRWNLSLIQGVRGSLKTRRKSRRKVSYFLAARLLGDQIGEKVYVAYRTGHISQQTMVSLFKQDVFDPQFEKWVGDWLKKLKSTPKILNTEERF